MKSGNLGSALGAAWGSGGLGHILGGIFGNSQAPFKAAQKQYRNYLDQAQSVQNPFFNTGLSGLGNTQDWLSKMQDPTKFINDIMGKYQESPYAKNLQQQSMLAGNNAASANGTLGSTPLQLQAQQNAANISSQDQNQWLQHVLGINTQYGAGQAGLAGMGQQSANTLTELFRNAGIDLGQLSAGQAGAKNQDFMSIISGLMQMFGG